MNPSPLGYSGRGSRGWVMCVGWLARIAFFYALPASSRHIVVSRDLEASVGAPLTWSTSTVQSPLCETMMYLSHPEYTTTNQAAHLLFLEQVSQDRLLHQHDENRPFMESFSYQDVVEYALDKVPPEEVALLRYALALRAHSPSCELHHSLAKEAWTSFGPTLDGGGAMTMSHVFAVGFSATQPPYLSLHAESILDWHNHPNNVRLSSSSSSSSSTQDDTKQEEMGEWSSPLLPGEWPHSKQPLETTTITQEWNVSTQGHVVILYGNMATVPFCQLYQTLVEAEVPFVVRHTIQEDDDDDETNPNIRIPTKLQGYGVRLDIRNVEYKAFEDPVITPLTDEEEEEQEKEKESTLSNAYLAGVSVRMLWDQTIAGEEEEDTGGKYNVTANTWKELEQELRVLHSLQSAKSQIIPPKWQRRKLSLQAATVITSGSSDVLQTLQHVSQNLPSVASTLVQLPVSTPLQDAAMEIQSLDIVQQAGSKEGAVGFYVNGRAIDVDRPTFNVFSLLQNIREEHASLQRMSNELRPHLLLDNDNKDDENHSGSSVDMTGALWALQRIMGMDQDALEQYGSMSSDQLETMAQENDPSSSVPFRIDVGRGWKQSVVYLTDIEKDVEFQQWPREVQQALYRMSYGMPPSVRRNLFTILIVIDPFDKPNPGLRFALELLQAEYPVRIGVVMASQSDVTLCQQQQQQQQNSNPSQSCTPSSIFGEANGSPSSLDDLKNIPATTQAVHRIFTHFVSQEGGMAGLSYLNYLLDRIQDDATHSESLSMYQMLEFHNEFLTEIHGRGRGGGRSSKDSMKATFDLLLQASKNNNNEGDNDTNVLYSKSVHFVWSKNLQPGMSFLNGLPLEEDTIGKIFQQEQQTIFQMIQERKITDSQPKSLYATLLTGSHVHKRLHPLLLDGDKSFFSIKRPNIDSIILPQNDIKDDAAAFLLTVVVDFETDEGLTMVSKVLSIMDAFPSFPRTDGKPVHVAYRIVPNNSERLHLIPLANIFASASRFNAQTLLDLVEAARMQRLSSMDTSCSALVNGLTDVEDSVKEELSELCLRDMDEKPVDKEMGNIPAANFLVANGRVYIPDQPSSIVKEDIELLLDLEFKTALSLTKLLEPHIRGERHLFSVIDKAASFFGQRFAQSTKYSRIDVDTELASLEQASQGGNPNPLYFSWNKNSDETDVKGEYELQVQVTVILDPLTESTQRVAPLLIAIRDHLKLPLTLVLAPRLEVGGDDAIPITSYYRFVADPLAWPDRNPPKALFTNLPTNHVLTIRMDVPESWDVQQTFAIQDTDNLRCDINSGVCGDDAHRLQTNTDAELSDITRVEYGLKSLLFFGQCYNAVEKKPPNGLQLTLTKPSQNGRRSNISEMEISADGSSSPLSSMAYSEEQHYSDTLVMLTVGYWQLRAQPGVWNLSIEKSSKGAEIFDIVVDESVNRRSLQLKPDTRLSTTKKLIMKDFVNSGEFLLVKPRPGFENAKLYSDENEVKISEEDETIHVFSLATGHVYERLLKIMMLSVTKRTSVKVKFWFLENFLSPTFKASAIAMAECIGCEVEFVTYKWPEWLRGQSEKQRIIWGYKILFLDVLFPLDVKKIIYVDADQVVRGDLKELWDLDLEGAPYGYTPMCDSRETTLGFQFWRSGFWATHLRGKPYHISALYVVDLERFRRELVGDKLRAIYQQLSADPNSLSNLDQDLPNYAQHDVRIHSLPQEWLWCESWCSDETKAAAKTIDLCNNPLHKEPKISMAKRVISGPLFKESWVDLDAEVEGYEQEYLDSLVNQTTLVQ